MYFLLNMGIFQPVMLVFRGVVVFFAWDFGLDFGRPFGKKTSRRKEAEPKDVSIILVVMIASWCVFSFRIPYIMTTVVVFFGNKGAVFRSWLSKP